MQNEDTSVGNEDPVEDAELDSSDLTPDEKTDLIEELEEELS